MVVEACKSCGATPAVGVVLFEARDELGLSWRARRRVRVPVVRLPMVGRALRGMRLRGMPLWALTLLVFPLLFSCRPQLSAATIRQHPTLSLDVLRPRVVDASAEFPPMWTRSLQVGDVSAVRFTGQSSGVTLDEAKVQAERDALAAVSNFIAVEVTSDFRAEESSGRTTEGEVDESDVSSVVRTHSNAQLRGVRMEAAYWEKIVDSPLTAQNATYRYFVRALIPKSEILRARLQKQLSRREESGQISVVILPFRASLVESETDGSLGVALTEELSRRLAGREGLHVSEPALVRAILPPAAELTEAEGLELVNDAFLPDLVVAGNYQVRGGRIRATFSLYFRQRTVKAGSIERPYQDVFKLEDDLLKALSNAIDAIASSASADSTSSGTSGTSGPSSFSPSSPRSPSTPSTPSTSSTPSSTRSASTLSTPASTSVAVSQKQRQTGAVRRIGTTAALSAYASAYERIDAGDLRGALAKLDGAWTAQPEDPRIALLMGRVLERLGRFGRLPPRRVRDAMTDPEHRQAGAEEVQSDAEYANDRANTDDRGVEAERDGGMPRICTNWSLISQDSKAVFMRAEEGFTSGREIEAWEIEAVNVDHVLSAVRFVHAGGLPPKVPGPARPLSAAGAYYRAFELALGAEEVVLAEEAEEALGALAIRVDRLDAAKAIFRTLLARGEARNDRHLMSLALYGYGKSLLGSGDVASALRALKASFAHRAVLGEKPYLLEIMNELGHALIQLGRYDEATGYLERARRIADELGIRYLSAVLENNLGIIDLLLGRTSRAEERFSRAFEVLDQQEDAEGRLSSALNIQQLGLYKGDIERARAYLALVRRLLKPTTPFRQVASYYEHQGSLSSAVGLHLEALRDLLRSFALFRQAGRSRDALRLRSNLIVADFRQHAEAFRRRGTSDGRDDGDDDGGGALALMQCSKDVAEDLFIRTFGDDLDAPVVRENRHKLSDAEGQDDDHGAWAVDRIRLVARLNAETLRGLVDETRGSEARGSEAR
ncbi:MAG: tetratricopeptide repeat protein [Deltaproteobacteria bacterium]|nr:tetratricopeptide repeat protein [Deltaproteobacteria bacterium]